MEAYKEFTVGCAEGIHARPAASLVRIANGFAGDIHIHHDGQIIDAKSILNILAAGIGKGARIKVVAAGESAESVLAQIESLLTGEVS